MKICQVTDYLPQWHQSWGGAEQACYRMIKLLSKEGHEIKVLSLPPAKEMKEGFAPFPIKTIENYSGKILGRYLKKIKLTFLPFDPLSFLHFCRILKRMKPDILHLHRFNLLSFSVVQSARRLGIPTLVTIYDYWSMCPRGMLLDKGGEVCQRFQGPSCIGCYEFGKFRSLQNFFLARRKRTFDFFLKRIEAFIVLSSSSSHILQRYGIDKEKIHVIPQAFSFPKIDIKKSKGWERLSILYTGWITPHKGLHIIIEALPLILEEIPEVKLYIIGEWDNGEYGKRVKNLIERHRLNKHLFILGKKSYSEVEKYLQKANVVVIPEQWENMSPVILVEAMAHAKPVVASAIGGLPEFVKDGENGFLVNPKDSTGFAKRIIWIFKNEREAIKMGEQARRDVMKICDEERILKKTLNLYNSLVKQ